MRKVIFNNDSASPTKVLFRRVGRPRKQWNYNTVALIWNHIRQSEVNFKALERSWFKTSMQQSGENGGQKISLLHTRPFGTTWFLRSQRFTIAWGIWRQLMPCSRL